MTFAELKETLKEKHPAASEAEIALAIIDYYECMNVPMFRDTDIANIHTVYFHRCTYCGKAVCTCIG